MLEAEALAAQKAFDRAGISLLKASERDVTTNLELQGHYHHTCGRVLEKHGSALAPFFVDRAYRLWRHRGNVCAMIEAQSEGGPPLEIKDYDVKSVMAAMPTRRPVHGLMTDPVVRSAVVVDSIANAFDLASSPELLAGELRQLITALGCESYAHVAETRTGSTTNGGASTEHVVSLGTERNRTLELRYCAADDPLTSILVADIARVVRSAVAVERMRREESERAAVWPVSDESDDDAVYVDDQMVTLIGAAKRVASVNVPVLITGETGTGKEILARAIHAASTRSGAVFMPFNCTACPRDMIDAQLFGHRRGAFTGATEHSPGVIRATIGGTLFLDEIGETPLDVQPKLLRFLESGEIHPIGETHPVKADVRVIAATNVDLDALVSAGRFREDLFYRLNIVRLHVPPLRERRVEIPTLSHHYLRKYAREFEKGDLRLAEDTMEYLWLYRWPGNVRQLANEVRRMAALAERDAVLMPEHLAPEIAASRRTVPPSERPLDVNEVVVRIDQPMAAALEHLERSMVVHALTACGGRIEETAKKLGLSRKGLYLKRQRFGLDAFEPQEKSA